MANSRNLLELMELFKNYYNGKIKNNENPEGLCVYLYTLKFKGVINEIEFGRLDRFMKGNRPKDAKPETWKYWYHTKKTRKRLTWFNHMIEQLEDKKNG